MISPTLLLPEESREICKLFNISPFETLSEGTLILTVKPEKASSVQKALNLKNIKNAVIGKIRLRQKMVNGLKLSDKRESLQKPEADPYWEAFWKANNEGWK